MDKETAEKISFHREPNPPEMVNYFHPSQIEKRFGGEAEQPQRFWPPHVPSLEFGEDPKNQISEDRRISVLNENPELIQIPPVVNA